MGFLLLLLLFFPHSNANAPEINHAFVRLQCPAQPNRKPCFWAIKRARSIDTVTWPRWGRGIARSAVLSTAEGAKGLCVAASGGAGTTPTCRPCPCSLGARPRKEDANSARPWLVGSQPGSHALQQAGQATALLSSSLFSFFGLCLSRSLPSSLIPPISRQRHQAAFGN